MASYVPIQPESLTELYKRKEVIERFLTRYCTVTPLSELAQGDLYGVFVKFCAENKIKAITSNKFGRHIAKCFAKLNYYRGRGGVRIWVNIAWRPEPFTGHLTPDMMKDWYANDGGDDKLFEATVSDKGYYPRPAMSRPKGVPFHKVKRAYYELGIFPAFLTTLKVGQDEAVRRDELWAAFDKFCEKRNLATCSAKKLAQELRLQEREDLAGNRWWLGVALPEGSSVLPEPK
jgi:hypothetical protein